MKLLKNFKKKLRIYLSKSIKKKKRAKSKNLKATLKLQTSTETERATLELRPTYKLQKKK